MKLQALILVAAGALALAGCGNVNIDNTGKTAKSSRQTAAEKSSAKAKAAAASQAARGKVVKYGLPTGPSAFYVTDNGQATQYHLSETTNTVAPLHENDEVGYGADLPLIGTFKSGSKSLSSVTHKADLDHSDKYAFDIFAEAVGGDLDTGDGTPFVLFPNANVKALTTRAFSDLQQYWAAVNSNSVSKLPTHTHNLAVTALNGDITNDNKPDKLTTVLTQYFDKKGLANNSDKTSLQLKVEKDGTETPVVQLYVPVLEKLRQTNNVKKTNGVVTNPDYGKKTTSESIDTLVYRLVNGKWALNSVMTGPGSGETSQYAQDTSGSNWIKQEVAK